RYDTVVESDSAARLFPGIRPMGVRAAIERAIANEDQAHAETRWSDALSSAGAETPGPPDRPGGRLVESRSIFVAAPPARAFEPIRRIGGERGWYYGAWLWRVRGGLDRLAGGPGLRRG